MAMVLTHMPLAFDRPIDFGVQEFCARWKKCAKTCPVETHTSR